MSFSLIFLLLALLIGIPVFFRFVLWPFLRTSAVLASITWRGREGLKPWTQKGRLRLLGIACFLVAVMLLLQARGYEVFNPILALINVEMPDLGRSTAGIFSLMIAGFAFAYLGLRSLIRAKRFDALPAATVLAEDPRPPVVYLRSFQDDAKASRAVGIAGLHLNTEEGEIAEIVKDLGPLIAIGRPGEALSYFGAARMYVDDKDWQERVCQLLSKASLVIFRAGGTAGLLWEIEQSVKKVPPERLIILIPFGRRKYDEFRSRVGNLLPTHLPDYLGRRVGVTPIHGVLYFDSDWSPHFLPVIRETYLRYYLGLVFSDRNPVFKKQSDLRRVLENVLQPSLDGIRRRAAGRA